TPDRDAVTRPRTTRWHLLPSRGRGSHRHPLQAPLASWRAVYLEEGRGFVASGASEDTTHGNEARARYVAHCRFRLPESCATEAKKRRLCNGLTHRASQHGLCGSAGACDRSVAIALLF